MNDLVQLNSSNGANMQRTKAKYFSFLAIKPIQTIINYNQ